MALLAATLPEAPVAIDILGVGLTAAITTIPAIAALDECYYGAVLIQPGCNISVQTSTATEASSSYVAFMWEECDLIA